MDRSLLLLCGLFLSGALCAQPTVPEILSLWGYPFETVTATTDDGYILEIHHILPKNNTKRPVVFLQHGLFASSETWINNLPNNSAGFLFADAGFDVWMGNMRGNDYSNRHISLSAKSEQYWEFSWDEMATYDLPAMVATVLERTGQDSLHYIGHSQGTLTMFAESSKNQNFAKKIRSFFALAPIATVKYAGESIQDVVAPLYRSIKGLPDLFGSGQFCPSQGIFEMVEDTVCEPENATICADVRNVMRAVRSTVDCLPMGTSTRNVLHWLQMAMSGRMQSYSYDSALENRRRYRSRIPPLYDVSKVTVETYLYWSDADALTDKRDVHEGLLEKLNPAILKGNVELKDLGHTEFTGPRAVEPVYEPIMRKIWSAWNAERV